MTRGRPPTIHISDDDLLNGINAAWQADVRSLSRRLARARAALAKASYGYEKGRLQQDILHAEDDLAELQCSRWVRYDLARFLGRELTASEKVKARAALRTLEAAGRVQLAGGRATAVRVVKNAR